MPKLTTDLPTHQRMERIKALLAEDWRSYEDLFEILDKPERTLRRDIERLVADGLPLEYRRQGRTKQFRIIPGSIKRPIEPGILEVIAANLGRGLLGFLQGTELRDEMERLFGQLLRSSRASERQLSHLERRFWFMADAPRDYAGHDEQINQIITCLLDERVAEILYCGRDRTLESLIVHPYTLIVRRECLYLLARVEMGEDTDCRSPRLFDLTRIDRCRRLKRTFTFPESWNPADCFRESFGVFIPREGEAPSSFIRIWLEESVGRSIQCRRWHESQRFSPDPAGGWLLEMRLRICPELVHWLLGFGAAARVLEPVELRDRVVGELSAAMRAYQPQ